MTIPARGGLDIAARIPVLSGLKYEALAVLLAEASVINLHSGHLLFRQEEPALAFFIIVEGWIKLYRITSAGDEAVLNVLTTGESLAEAVTFTSGRYPAMASAVTRARLVTIPADHVMNCIREMPDIALAMIASTSQHLHRMVQRIEQLTAQSATQRVADFLATLAPCSKGPCSIDLPYDKSVIAGRLGLKPESLSRIFAKLRPIGVDVRASHVVVSEVAQLRGLVASNRTRARGDANGKPARLCQGRGVDLPQETLVRRPMLEPANEGDEEMKGLLIGTAVALLTASVANAQDTGAGATAFKKCSPCHDIGPTAKNKVGPVLNGLDGRKSGSVAGYSYSDANKDSGITWNEQTFLEYIKDPKAKIPNTKMVFAGIKNEAEAKNLWAYLKQYDAEGKTK